MEFLFVISTVQNSLLQSRTVKYLQLDPTIISYQYILWWHKICKGNTEGQVYNRRKYYFITQEKKALKILRLKPATLWCCLFLWITNYLSKSSLLSEILQFQERAS